MMYLVENPMYEIGLLIENDLEREQVESIGHHVYEISLLFHENKVND